MLKKINPDIVMKVIGIILIGAVVLTDFKWGAYYFCLGLILAIVMYPSGEKHEVLFVMFFVVLYPYIIVSHYYNKLKKYIKNK